MKKLISLIGLSFIFNFVLIAQTKIVEYENFDSGPSSFTATSVGYATWLSESDLYVSYPYSYKGQIPVLSGQEIILESPEYNLSNVTYAYLRFSHICKISPLDTVWIEYAYRMGTGFSSWQSLSFLDYLGQASNYSYSGFNASSYSDWEALNLIAKPDQKWWKDELFDLASLAGTNIKFRFRLKKGSVPGTSVSYGWLIDNFEIVASKDPIVFPTVEFINPIVKDTLYRTGPFDVTVKILSNSSALIKTPYLKYTIVQNSKITKVDSVFMTSAGFGQWKGTLPQQSLNTSVHYFVKGIDMMENSTIIYSDYTISKKDIYGDNSAALLSIDSPVQKDIQLPSSPVKISIQNKGALNLDTLTVSWRINNDPPTVYGWSGNILWDYQDTAITIGSYTPTANAYDTLWVWISDPNNVTDAINSDDTLFVILFGCSSRLNGDIPVGSGKNISTLYSAIDALRRCGASNDINFILENGIYTENIDLTGLGDIMGSYQLTISPASGNDQVILAPESGIGITLGNTNNLVINNITIDASLGTHAIQFMDACSNISITNNVLKSNLIGTTFASGSPIVKNSNTGNLKNISIINNTIDGGYYGISLYGGLSDGEGKNIIIENNILTNQYAYGLNLYYNELSSVSFNTIRSRSSGTINPKWEGIYANYCRGTINANKIQQLSDDITQPYGIHIANMNYRNTLESGLVSNNEIILSSIDAGFGICLDSNINTSILQNSIYIGGTGSSNAIYIANQKSIMASVKNNSFVTDGQESYPIYLSETNFLNQWDIDYNNYYSPANIGFANGAIIDLMTWKNRVSSDANSIDSLPDFKDNTVSLELNSYAGMGCPLLENVKTDINNLERAGLTTIGCYSGALYEDNASLTGLINWGKNATKDAKDTIEVILVNGGSNLLSNVTIEWTFNNSSSSQVTSAKTLSMGDSVIITLGEVEYISGNNSFVVWVNSSGDIYTTDDTIAVEIYICDSLLNGPYIVGPKTGSQFSSIAEAIEKVYSCGINKPLVLMLQDTTYLESINLIGEIPGSSSINTVTITTESGNKENVIIKSSGGAGITLGNISNIIIDGITIDTSISGTYGVEFIASCENIEIKNSTIRANLTATTAETGHASIYKGTGTGVTNNIRIINNILDGGYNGFEFYGAPTIDMYSTAMTFKNNIISNQYNAAFIAYYTDFAIISDNTLYSKTQSTGTSWIGMNIQYCNGTINANRIKQQSNSITSPNGMIVDSYNYYHTSDSGLISNNEIMLSSTGTNAGLLINTNVIANIVQNSIYMDGSGAASGIQILENAENELFVQNNNIVTKGTASYPIYLSGTNYLNQWNINYNNMVAPTYVGYAAGNKSTMTEWKGTVLSAFNSVKVQPVFKDIQTNMEMISSSGILCPVLTALAPKDIRDSVRTSTTSMGAYHLKQASVNVTPTAIVSPGEVYNVGDSLSVEIKNEGLINITSLDIYWQVNGSTINSIHWTGTIVPQDSLTIVLNNNLTLNDVVNRIVIWTSKPNGVNDDEPYNDTVKKSIINCINGLYGVIVVGEEGDIADVKTAISILEDCGVSGAVEFALLSGAHGMPKLRKIQGTSETNTITFRPNNGNPADVIISDIVFDTIQDITIKDIIINVNVGIAAIDFTAPASNVEIRGCNIIANNVASSTTTGAFGIRKSQNTGYAENVRIVDNTINNGYCAIEFFGNNDTNHYGSNIIIDSNIINNHSYYGIYLRYIDAAKVSYNTVITNRGAVNNYVGIDMNNVNAIINANRIKPTNTTNPWGMTLTNLNSRHASVPGIVSNNEIYVTTSSLGGGFNVGNAVVAFIVHNTISSSKKNTIEIASHEKSILTIKNNIFQSRDGGYPIYLSDIMYLTQWNIDYNNYYGSNIGYARGAITNLAAWKTIVKGDVYSVSQHPGFVNAPDDMDLTDYAPFYCPTIEGINNDINNKERKGTTSMGCYATDPLNANIQLADLLQWNPRNGGDDSIKVVIKNGGITTVTQVNYFYSFNDDVATSSIWTGSLDIEDSVVITLNKVEYIVGHNTFKVWIDPALNNNGMPITDQFQGDNTITVSYIVPDLLCVIEDTIIVDYTGAGDFTTIQKAVDRIKECGLTKKVVVAIKDGTYVENVTITGPISGSSPINTITFTSFSGDTASVWVQRSGPNDKDSSVFRLTDISNIIFSKLTVNGQNSAGGSYGYSRVFRLEKNCNSIEINDCHIILPHGGTNGTDVPSSATYAHRYSAVWRESVAANATMSNIYVLNNLIEGGGCGVYLPGNSTAAFSKNIRVENNIFQDIDHKAVHFTYVEGVFVKNNTIIQRNVASQIAMEAIRLEVSCGDVINNKIKMMNMNYGIYLTNSLNAKCLILNNEIIGDVTGITARLGIHIATNATRMTYADIYHNSVYLTGTGKKYGIQLAAGQGSKTIDIQNNNFVLANDDNTSFPLHIINASNATYACYTFDYNNYYAGIGKSVAGSGSGGSAATYTMVQLRGLNFDGGNANINSVNVDPLFINPAIHLACASSSDLLCPLLPQVQEDINGTQRNSPQTDMGAYQSLPTIDVRPSAIVSPAATSTVGAVTPFTVTIQNLSTVILDSIDILWEVNGMFGIHRWRGSLDFGEISNPIPLTTFITLPYDNNNLVVITSQPNGIADDIPDNDTLRIVSFGCISATGMGGDYIVGTSPGSDFSTIAAAVKSLYNCGVNAPVIIKMQGDTYTENVILSGAIPGASDVNTITFTSVEGDTAVIQLDGTAYTSGIAPFVLDGVSHVTITNLHVNAVLPIPLEMTSRANSIILQGDCENIEISHCSLSIPNQATISILSVDSYLANIVQSNAGTITNLRIMDNMIRGGYSGINLKQSGTKTDILIQNNIIDSVDLVGITFRTGTANCTIKNNKIIQRDIGSTASGSFKGISLENATNSNVSANRIKAIKLNRGIDLVTVSAVNVINNEIIGDNSASATTASGIQGASSNDLNILHNSILFTGSTASKGITFTIVLNSYTYTAKNNYITTLTPGATYPVHITGNYATGISNLDIDYNNYYAPTNIGYLGSAAYTDLPSWHAALGNDRDANSVRVQPTYVDSTISLDLAKIDSISCPYIPTVETDINDIARSATTFMGAYIPVLFLDAGLIKIETSGLTNEQPYLPILHFQNYGSDTLKKLEIGWSLNGVEQTSPAPWVGNLAIYESATMNLITIPAATLGENVISAWVISANDVTDMNPFNDTISLTFYVCDASLDSVNIVGAGETFETIADAITKIKECGIDKNIELRLKTGSYSGNWDLINLFPTGSPYNVKITADTGANVTIHSAITIINTTNITIEGITISSTIQLDGCSDIIINNCHLLGSIQKQEEAGNINNIRITNNILTGGGRVYLLATSNLNNKNIVVDSNEFTNLSNTAIEAEQIGFVSISYNKITSSDVTNWYGMYLRDCEGAIVGNRIRHHGNGNRIYGISVGRHNLNNPNKNALIANNEIIINAILSAATPRASAIDIRYNSNIDILHNSILVQGTGESYGLYLPGSMNPYILRNNNIEVVSSDAYPIYFANSINLANLDINYNNYYSPNYIGYVNATAQTTLAAWKSIVTKDSHSISKDPMYIDISQGLETSPNAVIQCLRNANVLYDINGNSRTPYTTMGVYGVQIATGYDLELSEIVEPTNANNLCAPNYVSVKYAVRNSGSIDYDFTTDPLSLYFHMTGELNFDTLVIINTGSLAKFQTDTFELKNILDVSFAGDYNIKAWINNSLDTIHGNDTLHTIYNSGKIKLPYVNDFSGADSLKNLTVRSLTTDGNTWKVVGANYDGVIQPDSGTHKIIFDAPAGSVSELATNQIELSRTSRPTLKFWYAHDDQNSSSLDQTIVKVMFNGDEKTTEIIDYIKRYNANYSIPTWVEYTIDLSSYMDSSCVIILFEAISYGEIQHIDYISITSDQNLALDTLLLSDYTICDLSNKELKVVLSNTNGQRVDFTQTPIDIVLEIRGDMVKDTVITIDSDGMEGLETDTIVIFPNFTLGLGDYTIKAYISTASADYYRQDDTITRDIAIKPEFEIAIQTISTSTDRASAGFKNNQFIILENIGNMDLPDIELILSVNIPDEAPYFETTMTTGRNLPSKDTMHIYFDEAYTVPWSSEYIVTVYGYLVCDPTLVDTIDSELEYVDMNDLELVSIDKPESGGTIDIALSQLEVSVTITNKNPGKSYNPGEAKVGFKITDINGNQKFLAPLEDLPAIGSKGTISYTLQNKYTVPELEEYYLIVYIEEIDKYNQNDTLKMLRKTDYKGVSISDLNKISFTMEQNIPNPANNNTIIRYSVPQDGEINFKIHTMNGQILYNKVESVPLGEYKIELNLLDYAAGIYFYSMEYKGHRIVKKMSIKR